MKVERDTHHPCHDRLSWEARPESIAIRENDSMLARDMGRKAHDLLHYMTAPVPVPSMHTLQYVANRLPSGLDVISGIDTYSSLVEQAIKHPKAKYIEKELGLLSIQAIRAQIPYIEDGLPSTRRIIV